MNVLLCPLSDGGFLYPTVAVGLKLQGRGHTVSVLARASMAPILTEAGLAFLPLEEYGERGALDAGRWTRSGPQQYQAIVRAARSVSADTLVTSMLCHGALLAAEVLDLSAVIVGLATHLWQYQGGAEDEPQFSTPRAWRSEVNAECFRAAREAAGLPRWTGPAGGGFPENGTALLLRGDHALEYPGAVLPARVHIVGPCTWEPRADPGELNEVLDHLARVGKPVVYVHLGRLFGGKSPWPRLNAMFTGGPYQAIVELGRSPEPQPAPGADLLIVRKPWMRPLIDQSGLVLTAGTSAPVLGALLRGRPIGVSPTGSEHPLLAAALVRAGVAVHIDNQAVDDAQALLGSAWHDQGMRRRAQDLAGRLRRHDGPGRAADIIERISARACVEPAHLP